MSEVITETAAPKKRMLSGIKPSGDLTLGSYLGAVKNWAERANDYDCFYFMADLHAITVRQNPADLRRRILTHGDGVEVCHEIEAVIVVGAFRPVFHRA